MPRMYFVVLKLLLILLLAGCASLPEKTDPPLQRSEYYSEHLIQNRYALPLFVRRWSPTTPPRANVVILHGTALHSGLYEPVALRLTAAGYRVYAFDMQSWGRSGGLGGAGYVTAFHDYADDLISFTNTLKQNWPGVPNFVMGESLGGTVALYTALKDHTLFDGVITSAAGYKPRPKLLGLRVPTFINAMGIGMTQMGAAVMPKMPILQGNMGIRIVVEDEAVEAQLLKDPYVAHGWLPAVYASSLLDASNYIESNLQHLNIPILLMHGERDMLVPTDSSQEIYDNVASTHKVLRIYDSPHTILLENARDQAVQDVIQFLDNSTRPQMAAQ